MPMRRYPSRIPLAFALLIGASSACGGGGDDDGVAAEYETTPGPSVPQPPAERRLTADGECVITEASGETSSATLLTDVEAPSSVYNGRESGFDLEMACGATVAEVEVSLYFSRGTDILFVERNANRWTVDRRLAEVVPSQPAARDAAAEPDAGDVDASADASVPAPEAAFVNGVGFPATDGTRPVSVTLVANGVRYDIRATIPWRSSHAPATCQKLKPGTGTSGSGGGCGGGSSSRRSSGGDWD